MLLIVLSALCYPLTAQSPDDYSITNLPLYNNSNGPIPFKQYAGYIPLKDEDDTVTFFWFVESTNNPSTDPIFLWLNGGNGASAIRYGFWSEHGPFRLSKNATAVNLYQWSWNQMANMLYIDSPAGVGYSYANNPNAYNCTDSKTAYISFLFLDRFLSIFQEYKSNDLYISGESYAGHYVPMISEQILLHSDDPNYEWTQNMKGLIIGNPALEGDSFLGPNFYAYFSYLWSHGLLPQTAWIKNNQICNWNQYLTNCSINGTDPTPECIQINNDTINQYNLWYNNMTRWDSHDIYAPICKNNTSNSNVMIFNYSYDPCIDNYTPIYMNREDVWKALHVYDEYSTQNRIWPNHPDGWIKHESLYDSFKLFNEFFNNPVSKNWNITIYSGDADTAIPQMDTERWLRCLDRKVINDWKNWYLYDDVAGSVTVYDGITYETIKYCGHTLPTYCPVQGLLVLKHYLTGKY